MYWLSFCTIYSLYIIESAFSRKRRKEVDADFLLIHKMKNGDEEAIEVFVKKYYSTIRNYCRLHTQTVMQKILLKQHLNTFFDHLDRIIMWERLLIICMWLLEIYVGITMLVSAKTNSSVIAVILPFILIFLPSFLSGTSLPLLNKILGLLPDQMLQMNQVVKFFNLYEIGGKVFCAVPILIISYSILLLLIVPVIYFIYRRKEVYN